MPRAITPTEHFKAAIAADGRPLHRIAREAGVRQSVLWRFMHGNRSVTLTTLDRVAAVVDAGLPRRRSA